MDYLPRCPFCFWLTCQYFLSALIFFKSLLSPSSREEKLLCNRGFFILVDCRYLPPPEPRLSCPLLVFETHFQGFADAPALETVVEAGELLYIPSFWYHYIVSVGFNVQCNARSGLSMRAVSGLTLFWLLLRWVLMISSAALLARPCKMLLDVWLR